MKRCVRKTATWPKWPSCWPKTWRRAWKLAKSEFIIILLTILKCKLNGCRYRMEAALIKLKQRNDELTAKTRDLTDGQPGSRTSTSSSVLNEQVEFEQIQDQVQQQAREHNERIVEMVSPMFWLHFDFALDLWLSIYLFCPSVNPLANTQRVWHFQAVLEYLQEQLNHNKISWWRRFPQCTYIIRSEKCMECGQLGVLLFPILGAGSTFLLSSTKKKTSRDT